MKKKTIQLLFIVPLLLAFVSCKKYLDLRPDKKLTVPASLADLQALLDNKNVMNYNSPNYDIFSSDEYIANDAIYQGFSLNQRKAWVWENFEYLYPNDWAKTYDPVYYCNVVLTQLEDIDRTQANAKAWDNVKGSALVFRSMCYLRALWIFSKTYDAATAATDFGIALRTSSDFNQPVSRASVADCYQTVIDELMTAASILPENPVHPMRPSKAGAYGFLSRAYLSMRMYDSAFKYADLCLGIKSDLLDYNSTNINSTRPFGSTLNIEVILNQRVGVSYYGGGPELFVDSSIYQSLEVDDLRKRVCFRPVADGYQFKGTYSGSFGSQFTGIATDEMYLVRAECNARNGYTTEALADLNTLLDKRFVTGTFVEVTASSPEEVLERVLLERKRELFSRGLRWMDIKRLNREGAGIIPNRTVDGVSYSLQPNENRYALPLPTDIINLTGMPQNPL
ncbi:MAG: RagB/SusD family nutrient uptake outer membrane protein [Chitinophagaceae bacterium]|nr:MAG: RagB/SusD family nutrient uptake outer membrane protein [Chitinophagaceae bacterium]